MVIKKDGSVYCLSGLQNYRVMCCFKICNVPIGCSNREINHVGVRVGVGDPGMLEWGKPSTQVAQGTRVLISK